MTKDEYIYGLTTFGHRFHPMATQINSSSYLLSASTYATRNTRPLGALSEITGNHLTTVFVERDSVAFKPDLIHANASSHRRMSAAPQDLSTSCFTHSIRALAAVAPSFARLLQFSIQTNRRIR